MSKSRVRIIKDPEERKQEKGLQRMETAKRDYIEYGVEFCIEQEMRMPQNTTDTEVEGFTYAKNGKKVLKNLKNGLQKMDTQAK